MLGISKWLERQSLRDLDKWSRSNPLYEDQSAPASDNEHLFYINHKLQHANGVLERIDRKLSWIAILLGVIVVKYLGLLN